MLMQTFMKAPKSESYIQNQKLILEVLIDARDFLEIVERKQVLMQKIFEKHFPPDIGEKAFDATLKVIQQKRYATPGRVSGFSPPAALKGVEIKPHSTSQEKPFEPL